jgi:hypothetical protein
MPINGFTIRQTLLQVCDEYQKMSPGYFQANPVLNETAKRLAIRSLEDQQSLLTVWGDLFRLGVLAWRYDLSNTSPPFMHLTEVGRRTLSNLSRDPYNPEGYMAAVRPLLATGSVALSYLEEGLNTFQAGCLKATAVMVGAATESLVLDVRDTLVARLNAVGTPVPARLNDWKVKTVRDAVETEVEARRTQIDKRLYERFSAFWVAVSDQMRLARNDAGHPVSTDPVTHETVPAALLLFPEFAGLVRDLTTWISGSLT